MFSAAGMNIDLLLRLAVDRLEPQRLTGLDFLVSSYVRNFVDDDTLVSNCPVIACRLVVRTEWQRAVAVDGALASANVRRIRSY